MYSYVFSYFVKLINIKNVRMCEKIWGHITTQIDKAVDTFGGGRYNELIIHEHLCFRPLVDFAYVSASIICLSHWFCFLSFWTSRTVSFGTIGVIPNFFCFLFLFSFPCQVLIAKISRCDRDLMCAIPQNAKLILCTPPPIL